MYMYMTRITNVVHTFISVLRYVDFYSRYTPYMQGFHIMYTNIILSTIMEVSTSKNLTH